MIKHCVFKFKRLDEPNYWVSFARFGEMISFTENYFDTKDDHNIGLDPERTYQIGIDQSSTNSGIFIKDFYNEEVHMIEVSRDRINGREEDAGDYIWKLEMFLKDLAAGCKISHLIYERPINTGSYRSSQILFQLEGVIQTLKRRYPEFKAARIENIENASWRSVIITKDVEALYGRKEASKASVNMIFPWTKNYGFSIGKDQDVFEAMGILMGWFFKSFDPLGRPYVRGDRTSRAIGGYVLPGLPGEKVVEMLKKYDIKSELYIQNPDYSIYQNLAAKVRPYETVCVEFNSKHAMLCMCIECNIQWFDPDVMTVILVDAATVDSRLREIAGDYFHFVL